MNLFSDKTNIPAQLVIPSRNEHAKATPIHEPEKKLQIVSPVAGTTSASNSIPSSKESSPTSAVSTPFSSKIFINEPSLEAKTTNADTTFSAIVANKDKKKKKAPTETVVAQPKIVKKPDTSSVWNNENALFKKREIPGPVAPVPVVNAKDDKKLFVKRPKPVPQPSPPTMRSKSKMSSVKSPMDDIMTSPRSPRVFDISLAPTEELVSPIKVQKSMAKNTGNTGLVEKVPRAQPSLTVDVKGSVSNVSFKQALVSSSKPPTRGNEQHTAFSPYNAKPSVKRESRHPQQSEPLTKAQSSNTVLYPHPSNGSTNANIAVQQLPKLLQQQQQLQQLQNATLLDNTKQTTATARKPKKSSIILLSKNVPPTALAYEMTNRPSTSAGTYDGHHVHSKSSNYGRNHPVIMNQLGQLPPSLPQSTNLKDKIFDDYTVPVL